MSAVPVVMMIILGCAGAAFIVYVVYIAIDVKRDYIHAWKIDGATLKDNQFFVFADDTHEAINKGNRFRVPEWGEVASIQVEPHIPGTWLVTVTYRPKANWAMLTYPVYRWKASQ